MCNSPKKLKSNMAGILFFKFSGKVYNVLLSSGTVYILKCQYIKFSLTKHIKSYKYKYFKYLIKGYDKLKTSKKHWSNFGS